jgi:alpha-tubulin suppressor-like RCC1 family protein
MALDSYGAVYSWGGGGSNYNKGQCGHGVTEDMDVPQIVADLRHKAVKQISAGGFHSLALCEDNELYSWGSGTFGELGAGDQQSCSKPKLVPMPYEAVVI